MKINKGSLVQVHHRRKGMFKAIALETFDTKNTEFYPLAVAEGTVEGKSDVWVAGEAIPCKKTFCIISLVD